MPTPPTRPSPSPSPQPGSSSNNASNAGQTGWSQEQQAEFMRALMAAPEITGGQPQGASAPFPGAEAGDDPMAAMLNALTQMTGQAPPGGTGGMFPSGSETLQMQEQKPKSLFVRLRPILHLLLTWILLAYFAFVQEPQAYAALPGAEDGALAARSIWDRWAELGRRVPSRLGEMSFGVQVLVSHPYHRNLPALSDLHHFQAFLLGLHDPPTRFAFCSNLHQIRTSSYSLFHALTQALSRLQNPIQPPTLLALALPHLPPQLRSLITNGLAYLRMGGMLLDDIACLIFGIGLLVWVAGWVSG